MTAASIVNKRKFTPSIDLSDATIPIVSGFPSEYTELAARVIRRKAQSDADRITLAAMLGVDE